MIPAIEHLADAVVELPKAGRWRWQTDPVPVARSKGGTSAAVIAALSKGRVAQYGLIFVEGRPLAPALPRPPRGEDPIWRRSDN